MNEKNLWGDLKNLEEIITPKFHLNVQANLLFKLTNSMLYGEVTSDIDSNDRFEYGLDIIAPSLNNYRYTILMINHHIDPYPLRLYDLANDKDYECKTEEAFLRRLEEILSSKGVRRIIASLINQSR